MQKIWGKVSDKAWYTHVESVRCKCDLPSCTATSHIQAWSAPDGTPLPPSTEIPHAPWELTSSFCDNMSDQGKFIFGLCLPCAKDLVAGGL